GVLTRAPAFFARNTTYGRFQDHSLAQCGHFKTKVPAMNVMSRVRLYHATLAILAILAYLTGEVFPAHAWLGYGVAFVIAARLAWAIGGERQFGLTRFYPDFSGLKLKGAATHPAISRTLMLGIALTLVTATGTGIVMDGGRSLPSLSADMTAAPAVAGGRTESIRARDHDEGEREGDEGPLSEVHELSADLLLLFVGLHVAYLILFKRPLAKFMLFLPRGAKRKPPST
ncbi:MAG: cytochrome b/b6 domain-containing protein, partial [Alphaproteobacteria bacterium]|nr:cytochrome b/b6 domain-containing protein [Alphaproteobacteria bacterium]